MNKDVQDRQDVKERPVLFSGPMVRAILDGRKTQTRRVIKGVRRKQGSQPYDTWKGWSLDSGDRPGAFCPYGTVGDRLWVRETWRERIDNKSFVCVQYASDETIRSKLSWENGEGDPATTGPHKEPLQKVGVPGPKWRPSIHMPRWASRITLEITGVRVERLNEISEQDAKLEGIEQSEPTNAMFKDYRTGKFHAALPLYSFFTLWESINGHGSWQANPWLWVIEFKRVQP